MRSCVIGCEVYTWRFGVTVIHFITVLCFLDKLLTWFNEFSISRAVWNRKRLYLVQYFFPASANSSNSLWKVVAVAFFFLVFLLLTEKETIQPFIFSPTPRSMPSLPSPHFVFCHMFISNAHKYTSLMLQLTNYTRGNLQWPFSTPTSISLQCGRKTEHIGKPITPHGVHANFPQIVQEGSIKPLLPELCGNGTDLLESIKYVHGCETIN